MGYTNWMGGAASTIAQQLRISKNTELELDFIAVSTNIPVIDLVRAAILKILDEWKNEPDSNIAARNDVLLTKLKT